MFRTKIVIATVSLAVFAAAAAHAAGLNVKPGLWETTMQGQVSGAFPIPQADLDKMPPEARARMQAAMQASMAAMNKPHSARYCLTQAQIDKGFGADAGNSHNQHCTHNVVSSSANEQTIQVVCKGEGESTNGTFHIVAASPTAVSGTFDMTMSGKANMQIHQKLTSRWLGTDCGAIKPGQSSMQ